ncbi:hypothetical protein [Streptomyces sp. CoH17]|uniref:hypothetical protein n=1 Tax=Streptomyces sp. CoH17 TaxID=2992806 RepID=UPI00226D63E0|nr:hypothetical protein [Streptomyces sp. CoH17]
MARTTKSAEPEKVEETNTVEAEVEQTETVEEETVEQMQLRLQAKLYDKPHLPIVLTDQIDTSGTAGFTDGEAIRRASYNWTQD